MELSVPLVFAMRRSGPVWPDGQATGTAGVLVDGTSPAQSATGDRREARDVQRTALNAIGGVLIVGLLVAVIVLAVRPTEDKPQAVVTGSVGACEGSWPVETIDCDFVIVGAGPAGLATADDLSKALLADGTPRAQISICVVEARAEVGGNLRRVQVTQPAGYDGSFGQELYGQLGGQRINLLTMTEERRRFADLNITVFWSPFRNIVEGRGHRMTCKAPSAFTGADAFSLTNFCTDDPVYIDSKTGAYGGGVGATASGNPSADAYKWILAGNDAPAFDKAINGAGNDGSTTNYFLANATHPISNRYGSPRCRLAQRADLAQRQCCRARCTRRNRLCVLRACELGKNCPIDRCKGQDYRSFAAQSLADPAYNVTTPPMNYEYANYLQVGWVVLESITHARTRECSHAPDSADAQFDNVGFHSDFEDGFGACSYINYQVVHSFCDPLSLGRSRHQSLGHSRHHDCHRRASGTRRR